MSTAIVYADRGPYFLDWWAECPFCNWNAHYPGRLHRPAAAEASAYLAGDAHRCDDARR